MAVFKLDITKAIEATATLIRLSPHTVIGRKRLLALLYLADRESLRRSRRPIIGGRLAAMRYGPVHREVNDLIKGVHRNQAAWSKYFSNDAHLVTMRHDLDVSALSRFEVGVLNEISQQFMGDDDWDVADATRALQEYKKAYQEGKSSTIPFQEVIHAVGLRKREEAILRDAAEKAHLDRLFSVVPKRAKQLARK